MTPEISRTRVEESCAPDQAIVRLGTARTAFVGRTLRGPINQPILLGSFVEFQYVFGGLWQPSLLGYAVEQFFDNGGREALIVRVVNGARAATLTLSAGTEMLRLRAKRPGTREFLRVSVDYDNIAACDTADFNLTVQRVRAHGTAQVEDQEIFHKLSLMPSAENYLPCALKNSELLQLMSDIPTQRPDQTLDAASGLASGYVNSNSDGDDGAPLTDYDLIGSPSERTGLFALDKTAFNFLCIPPLSRDKDVGSSTLLVAARYCKERRALMIVDPPVHWHTADDAVRGIKDWNFCSENALMYFPRVLALDKLRGHVESFAPCGAVAGMLARRDESFPVWSCAKHDEAILRPGYRLACLVTEERRMRLANLGVNTLQTVRSATRIGIGARTLAAGTAASADWQYLDSRRLALFIINSIEYGTRWLSTTTQLPMEVAALVASQVCAFFELLYEEQVFGARRMQDAFSVICDRRSEFQLVIGFVARIGSEFHGFRIVHSAVGSKVTPVSLDRLNAMQYSPAELEWVDNLARRLSGSNSI